MSRSRKCPPESFALLRFWTPVPTTSEGSKFDGESDVEFFGLRESEGINKYKAPVIISITVAMANSVEASKIPPIPDPTY